MSEELFVVVRDEVAGDEEGQAQCEQGPRGFARGTVEADAHQDRDHGREAEDIEERPGLGERGEEVIRQSPEDGRPQVQVDAVVRAVAPT